MEQAFINIVHLKDKRYAVVDELLEFFWLRLPPQLSAEVARIATRKV